MKQMVLMRTLALATTLLLLSVPSRSETLEVNSNTTTTAATVAVTTTNPDTGASTTVTPGITTAPADVTAPDPNDPLTNTNAQMADVTIAPEECIADLKIIKSTGEQTTLNGVDVCGLAGLILEDVPEDPIVFVAPPGEEEGITEETPPE